MESSQGFHAIINLFLIPLWMLSGALFPVSGASGCIEWLMRINPAYLRHGRACATCSIPGTLGGVSSGFVAGDAGAVLPRFMFGLFSS